MRKISDRWSRLRFAIELAERPLDTLTHDDWSRLQRDLVRFLVSTVGNVTTGSDPPDPSREDVRALKAVFRQVLEQVARGLSQPGPQVKVHAGLMRLVGPTGTKVRAMPVDTKPDTLTDDAREADITDGAWILDSQSTSLEPAPKDPTDRGRRTNRRSTAKAAADRRFMFTVSGNVRACALAVLMYLLAHEPVDRIRRCSACSRFFIKRKGQKFCREASCEKARTARYWQAYLRTAKGKRARRRALKKQYEQHGWRLGFRTRRLPSPKPESR